MVGGRVGARVGSDVVAQPTSETIASAGSQRAIVALASNHRAEPKSSDELYGARAEAMCGQMFMGL
ncbi:MAG: hypothetical protein ACOC1F_02125 [Myxococcota bacterium]